MCFVTSTNQHPSAVDVCFQDFSFYFVFCGSFFSTLGRFLNTTEEFLTEHFLFVGVFQTQRRVTFHLPDGSQESCSDSGLGDPEPSSTASTTQPLPLSFPQDEYYEQTSPNSRTEGDGNSDPESSEYWILCSAPDSRQIFNLWVSLLLFLWVIFRGWLSLNVIYKRPSVFFRQWNNLLGIQLWSS